MGQTTFLPCTLRTGTAHAGTRFENQGEERQKFSRVDLHFGHLC
jgi:hypothetical protein